MTIVLALDLASVTGWALGEPGSEPTHGTHRFAAKDASHEAVFYKCMLWTQETIIKHNPGLIVWESPLASNFGKKGETNIDTTALLHGLPAIVGAIAYMYKIYDVRKAATSAIRQHFINCNPKRAEAKPMVMEQCRAMGWEVEDDNEADALATWSYMCSLLEPKQAMRPTPLWLPPAGRARRAGAFPGASSSRGAAYTARALWPVSLAVRVSPRRSR